MGDPKTVSASDEEMNEKRQPPKASEDSPAEVVGLEHAIGELRFIINKDGSVTFTNLPPEMIDIARSLDPDATLACDVADSAPQKPSKKEP